jgi:hypothetical protein
MTRGWWTPAVIAAFALAGCGAGESSQRAEAMTFRVNPERLGARFADTGAGFTLAAPAGWDALPESLLAAAMDRLRAGGEAPAGAEPALLALYREEPEGALLAVSSYAREFTPSSRDSLAMLHLRAMQKRHAGGQVADGRFVYRGYEVVQIRAVDDRAVAFKLFLSRPGRSLVQLDYVVPRGIYPRELEAVESSIGSLEPKS